LLYDRFLPVLVKHLDGDKMIVDVGANIGDTALSLINNCSNPITCIEPSDKFFSYLKANIPIGDITSRRITLVKELVGTGRMTGSLHHSAKGTATLQVKDNAKQTTHVPLDSLVSHQNVVLLKVDTDGFDFDVILSASTILTESEPVLFWENDISEEFQREGYDSLYEKLEKLGYQYIYIFDNYGNLITEESRFLTLSHINRYLYSIKKHNNTRTFYYTDVVASTEKNIHLLKKAVEDYQKNWILKSKP
jgi:FkbM family methyltransferase